MERKRSSNGTDVARWRPASKSASIDPAGIDLASVRAKLESGHGPAFWKSLDAVAETPAFRRFLEREYPAAAHLAKGPDRRGFFKIMAASFALSGLAACDEVIDGRQYEVPYVRQPERIEPGKPLVYASSTIIDGFANGILVTTVDGRPIKIEGNPQHPWSRGGTDIYGQASVLGLYDPTRSQAVRYLDKISDWDSFRNRLLGPVAQLRDAKGKGLRILTGPVTSPSFVAQMQALVKAMPEAKWHMMSSLGAPALETASQAVFGSRVDTLWHFDKAKVIVAIDGDFLDSGPRQVGVARRFAEARDQFWTSGSLLTLHVATSTPSLTSAKADYHLAVEPPDIAKLVDRLAAAIATAPADGTSQDRADAMSVWIARAATALRDARSESIVMAGDTQSPDIGAAVHRLNASLGNIGKTITFIDPVLPRADSLADLVTAMDGGEVDTLVVMGCNPVYEALGDFRFAKALAKVRMKIHAGAYVDETALRSDWHLPLAHPLESWGDARAIDGTASLIQPTIRPLYLGRTEGEIVSLLFDEQARDGLAIVKSHWQGGKDAVSFEAEWHKALNDGFIAETASAAKAVTANSPPPAPPSAPLDIRPDHVSVVFRPDPTIRDSSNANNGWLQELPKPLTKIVWDNVVAIGPALAQKLKVVNGDVVAVAQGEISVEGAAWILPGQADQTVTMTLGYGRNQRDAIYDGLGYDANPLRRRESPWLLSGAFITKTGRKAVIATTQDHNTMEGHDFIRVSRASGETQRKETETRSLYGNSDSVVEPRGDASQEPRAWGMVIDTDTCIGCNACVVACQSENNIAIVGKEQVHLGRDMHWLRIDRYYSTAKSAEKSAAESTAEGHAESRTLDDPDTHFQPVPCMMCELAPCEVGCPVEATLHDHEGLNVMVYNRCVGTRACSGYCPYKVRHFNYLDYTGGQSPAVQTRNNPDVTVRSRGVMEKCTYCVQRIAEARITADKSNAPIADGMVKTACQSACPTQAISFGNLADPKADVVAKRNDPRNYDLLGELNVRPRTTYLAERGPAVGQPDDSISGKAG